MNIGLEFLPNVGGEGEGLSDAGIETFREKPFAAVARETGQNSRDARNDADKPVLLKFDVICLPTSEFPSIKDYKSAARLCLAKSQLANNEKEIGFFRNALSSLEAEELKILRIADFNTKGVRGPCEEGQPFHALAKTDGMSVKEEVSSGGSFGIGKNATFALSDIQTVFLSTLYRKNDSNQVLCMGKTQFISHKDENGNERRRKGYWGRIDGYMPLDNPDDIPTWLRREKQGTSLFSISLRDSRTDWRYEMTAAILINFFSAIERQEMEFEIENASIRINKNTIQSLFNNAEVTAAVDQLELTHAFRTARTLHECLIDNQTSTQRIDVPNLGEVKMHTLLRTDLGYTVGIIRNGMYITDNLSNFNEPFKRFPLYKEFAVVIEPAGTKEGEWFKRLENPSHDTLSADRITDPKMRATGQRIFSVLAGEIRRRIKDVARAQPINNIDLDELNEFFVADGSRTEDELGTETDPRAKDMTNIEQGKPAPIPPIKQPDPNPGPEPEPEPNPNPSPDPDPDPTPGPLKPKMPVELVKERALIPDIFKPTRRRLIFTSPVSAEITIYTDATGLNSKERLSIINASIGKANNSALEIYCDEGKRVTVDVEFENGYQGPVEISAYQAVVPEGHAS